MIPTIRRLLPYLREERWTYVLGALCVVASVVLKLTVPWLLGGALQSIEEATGTSRDDATAAITRYALFMLAAAGIGALLRTASRVYILGNSRRGIHNVRRHVFDALLRLAPSFYIRHRSGQILSRVVNDVVFVQSLLGPVFLYIVETSLLYAVCLSFMLAASPLLTLLCFLPIPFFLILAKRLATRIQRDSRRAQDHLGSLSAKVDETLSGQRIVKSLALEDAEEEKFRREATTYRDALLDVARSRAKLQPLTVFLAALSICIVLGVGAPLVTAGELTLGDLTRMLLYATILAAPTGTLGFVLSSLERGRAALDRVGELIDMPRELEEPETAHALPSHGDLVVENLTVRFAPLHELPMLEGSLEEADPEQTAERVVLDRVSFHIPYGETWGVVGETGAGKSVLLRALSRQLEVPRGTIRFGGVDIRDAALAEWRALVGLVPQESFLFGETLAENVALGRPGASRAEIEEAIRLAQLERDLPQLPNGIDTVLGERGVNLSGGQRQRAALARVLLMDPKILLLDDTLSAVDEDSAERILLALGPVLEQATGLIVSHRVATVRNCARILVLHGGRIVESGRHDDLVAQGGTYAKLFEKQATTSSSRARESEARP